MIEQLSLVLRVKVRSWSCRQLDDRLCPFLFPFCKYRNWNGVIYSILWKWKMNKVNINKYTRRWGGWATRIPRYDFYHVSWSIKMFGLWEGREAEKEKQLNQVICRTHGSLKRWKDFSCLCLIEMNLILWPLILPSDQIQT